MPPFNRRLVPFTKMHGLGNDFAVIYTPDNSLSLDPGFISRLANRHIGIGFDQLLLIETSARADFFCRIYNADGSEAEQCGNGLRCVARLIHEQGLSKDRQFEIETRAGIFSLQVYDYDHIQIIMGTPQIESAMIELELPDTHRHLPISILSMGNPHAIIKVDSLITAGIEELAPRISAHSRFPEGVNIGFMQVLSKHHIRLRTHERGSGPTLACGSNACAAVAAGIANGWLNQSVNVEFEYGSLDIEWQGDGHTIKMTGPAVTVYTGEISLPIMSDEKRPDNESGLSQS
ncbi:Diaminopimelate epimerase [Aquicella siphonis]|uniref:Diaminopimelate epimerase n=1 Tax=Aquicella siphonis TaxID=254247 RepID=A0A5E4PKV6_9COXI|nr:diaminopimelate epimerase [Aquicella siphonis]VVC76882.1 Diaminopimelate epimerase [Aquicella siphonis]